MANEQTKINPEIWGTEEDWIDVANRPTPEVLPYSIDNYCEQGSKPGLTLMEAKIPYLKQNNWNAGTAAGDGTRAMWRGLFLANEFGPEANKIETGYVPTEHFPVVWGLGANSPMANSYFLLPGYITGDDILTYPAGGLEIYLRGLNTDYSPSNYGTNTNDWHNAQVTPFCFTAGQGNSNGAVNYRGRNFVLPVNSSYMHYNGTFSGNPILSFNYQNIVIYPVLYIARKNDMATHGYDFTGPVSLESYFDGIDWDPDTGSGTPPLQETYEFITSVGIGYWYMGPNNGTRRTGDIAGDFGGIAPGLFDLHEIQTIEMLFRGLRSRYTTLCESKYNGRNCYQSIQVSLLSDGIISGAKSGVDQFYTFELQPSSRVDTDGKAFVAFTCRSDGAPFRIFYQNGHYSYVVRQQTDYSNLNRPYKGYVDFISLWRNATKEEVLRDVAYAGFWFSENENSAATSATGENCTDPKMHIPVFDSKGITTGEYKSGTEAAQEPNAKWQDPFKDNPYKPGDQPDPPTPPTPVETNNAYYTVPDDLDPTKVKEIRYIHLINHSE